MEHRCDLCRNMTTNKEPTICDKCKDEKEIKTFRIYIEGHIIIIANSSGEAQDYFKDIDIEDLEIDKEIIEEI